MKTPSHDASLICSHHQYCLIFDLACQHLSQHCWTPTPSWGCTHSRSSKVATRAVKTLKLNKAVVNFTRSRTSHSGVGLGAISPRYVWKPRQQRLFAQITTRLLKIIQGRNRFLSNQPLDRAILSQHMPSCFYLGGGFFPQKNTLLFETLINFVPLEDTLRRTASLHLTAGSLCVYFSTGVNKSLQKYLNESVVSLQNQRS